MLILSRVVCRGALLVGLGASSLVMGVATSDRTAQASTLNIYNGGPAPGLDVDLGVSITGTTATFTFVNHSLSPAAGSDVQEIYFESGLASLLGPVTTVHANATGTSAGVSLIETISPSPPVAQGGITPASAG